MVSAVYQTIADAVCIVIDYLASQSKNFFEKLCGRNISTFAAALCDSGLTKEELAELRDMLKRGTL